MQKTIIWDWNGTLLNDIDICIRAMNNILEKRNYEKLTRSRYREIFTFPVKSYYEKAGIDLKVHAFSTLADEFIAQYYADLPKATLFEQTSTILLELKRKNIQQVIISAMEHRALLKSLRHFNIDHFFDSIIGIENHLANGKKHMVEKFLSEYGRQRENFVMIGDTLHDCEIGNALGIDVFLVASGHQSYDRLKKCKAKVLHNLSELSNTIKF